MTIFAGLDNSKPPLTEVEGVENSSLDSVSINGNDRAIVFSRRSGWLEVGLSDSVEYRSESVKRVWIEDSPSRWTVQSVNAPEAERLLGRVWGPEALPAVEVLETRRVNGTLGCA